MSTVNLYDVLNVDQDCTIKEIKEAYITLAKEFHPDRPNGDNEMFELVTHAYNILINPNTRTEYDEIYALSKQTDANHFDMKIQSKEFYKTLDASDDDIEKKKSKAESDFDKLFEEMDKKHGYKRDASYEAELDASTTKKRLQDLEITREQDDIESIHEKIFDDGRFDLNKFNAAFDAMHKGHTELIPHTGNPLAYNVDNSSNFSSIDTYDDLYVDDDDVTGSSLFGSVKLDSSKKVKLTKKEVDKIKPSDYTKGHNYKDPTYNKSIEEKLKERELETHRYENVDLNDFDTDPSCGGYGIFNQLGVKGTNNLMWDNDDDIKTRYKRLLDSRRDDTD